MYIHNAMRLAGLATVAAVAVSGCASLGTGGPAQTGFLNKTMVVDGEERDYVLFVPRDYDPGKKWPLIVFLHGAGERGSDGYKQSEVGIGSAIRRVPREFPCLVLMPQCPANWWWSSDTTDWAKKLKPATQHIHVALADTLKAYSVDKSRIYLTGLSMGGFGTWVYGAQHTGTFAALMPICGGGRLEDAKALATVPIRVFHGADDSVVPAEMSRKMVEAVKAAGGDIAYTEFPGTDHNSWDKTYRDNANIRWLLEQRKQK